MADRDVPVTSRIRSWLRTQRITNEEFQPAVGAMNVDSVRCLSDLSGVELIARDPNIPGARQ